MALSSIKEASLSVRLWRLRSAYESAAEFGCIVAIPGQEILLAVESVDMLV